MKTDFLVSGTQIFQRLLLVTVFLRVVERSTFLLVKTVTEISGSELLKKDHILTN